MAIRSLQATVDAWKAGTQLGQQRYLDAVAASDVDVVGRAISSQGALVQNFNARVQDGTWARRLSNAGNQGWKNGVANGGGVAWSNGITNSATKYQNRMQLVLQVEAGLQQQIDGMPSGTSAAGDARMLAWKHGMEQAKANGAFG